MVCCAAVGGPPPSARNIAVRFAAPPLIGPVVVIWLDGLTTVLGSATLKILPFALIDDVIVPWFAWIAYRPATPVYPLKSLPVIVTWPKSFDPFARLPWMVTPGSLPPSELFSTRTVNMLIVDWCTIEMAG